jgi:preprotein translocase subunit YajC
MAQLIFLVFMVAVGWLFFILPQQRRMRAHHALVAQLDVGDEVMTTSGVLGTIADLDDEIVHLEVAAGVTLRVVRGAIARRITAPEAVADIEPAPSTFESYDALEPDGPASDGHDAAVLPADGEPADSDT